MTDLFATITASDFPTSNEGEKTDMAPAAPAPIARARAFAPSVILAIDPGTTQSGWVEYDAESHRVLDSDVMPNAEILARLERPSRADTLAVEMIASYGMAVGREVFETCVWIGRFVQAWHMPDDAKLVYRRDVKLHLCGTAKAKDPNIRQAILDLFPSTGGGKTPQIGTKSQPGPLYGVSSHVWAALGVALTAKAQMKQEA